MMTSLVYLKESQTGEMVEATLYDEVLQEHLDMWNATWRPIMEDLRQSRSPLERPEDSHWNWPKKVERARSLLAYQSFALVCRDQLQGLLLVRNTASAKLEEQFGKPIVYVELVATAPWNRKQIQSPPAYIGVGRIFMLASIELSRELGFCGRIGLHALSEAELFYERCGFTRMGNDSSHQNLCYFEGTEEQAEAFRHNQEN